MLTPAPVTPAFTFDQHATVTAWRARQPLDLSVRVALDHEEAEEVLEVYRHDWTLPLYFITPADANGVMLDNGRCRSVRLASIKAALLVIEASESIDEQLRRGRNVVGRETHPRRERGDA